MDATSKKTFQVKIKSLTRTLKQYKAYLTEVSNYDLTVVSQQKKQQQFYEQSKSALNMVENKLLDFYGQLTSYINQNKQKIESQEEESVKADYNLAKTTINEIKALLPAAC